MKIETLEELVSWCSRVHAQLADRMNLGAERSPDGPTRWLMAYVAGHEAQMAQQMNGIKEAADPRALKTWVYDWLDHPLPKPEVLTEDADRQKAFEAVSRAVFDLHNELMTTLRFLIDRADIPEAQELLEQMLSLEEGHTRQIGQQVNRIRDM